MSEEEPKRKLKRPAMPGAGRPLGALNKFTRDLKQAMLDAGVLSDYATDSDNEDTPGTLTQYMVTVANKHPELFFQALAKLIPHEIKSHRILESTVNITYRSLAEVRAAMLDAGMSPKQIEAIASTLDVIEDEKPEAHDDAGDGL